MLGINNKAIVLILLAFVYVSCSDTQEVIDLSGVWNVQLDVKNKEFDYSKIEGTTIQLPGSLTENGIGIKTIEADTARLTSTYKYVGAASYSKEIEIPKEWKSKEISLFLERVLWESKVYVDGVEKDTKDALGTPHIHHLGLLTPGKHTLTILVNNEMIHDIGVKGHAYTEHTQTLWNGIVGRMELIAKNDFHIEKTNVFGDFDNDNILVQIEHKGILPENSTLHFVISSVETGKAVLTSEKAINSLDTPIEIPLNNSVKAWSEYSPNLYELYTSIIVDNSKSLASSVTTFGLRKVNHDGTKIHINNIPTFLRGNLDNVHFPLTGYPSCKVEDWERIFKAYKEYGLNHVRFHSWCPPEAAFIAADKLGIYIQAEASVWLDWWMPNTIGVGKDSVRDQFIRTEMDRVIDTYGNHPSFIMFGIGNELGSADFKVTDKWIGELKKRDPRRLYAVSTARKITKNCDYAATHFIEGIGLVRGIIKPTTNWDYENVYGPNNLPVIAHEIGQWPVYPDWKEIDKYTGVLKARNFEVFREQARENGIEDQSRQFQLASGALNQLLYKYEIESFLRTPGCAGIQLLGINDYPGQGEALIGWLDAFWDSKNITTSKIFKKHFNTTVPLARFDKFVWTNDEILEVASEISHHGETDLKNKTVVFSIYDETDNLLFTEKVNNKTFLNGSVSPVSTHHFPLNKLIKAIKLRIHIAIEGTEFENDWNIWVFPKDVPRIQNNTVVETNSFNNATIKALEAGKTILLDASKLGSKETSVKFDFYSLYWSLTYFPGQGKTNIGLLLNEQSQAISKFPTSYHSDWQWEPVSNNSKAFVLNELPKDYKPIGQPVDDFHRNNKMGILFELKVGKGKLLVSGFSLSNNSPATRQLKYSLLQYMNSDEFQPKTEVSTEWLSDLFSLTSLKNKVIVPEIYKDPIVYIKASGNLKENTNVNWKKENDLSLLLFNSNYIVTSEHQNKDGWNGDNIMIIINCPKGILGTFFLKVKNTNSIEHINFEGRPTSNKVVENNGIVKYHIMREDSQDGILKLHLKGRDLIIAEVAIVKE
ncbi:glycoside hydrolase family 2 [Labilibacter sediminis]|nr:glycoside hydrolase family 2 [Labilibacter sediminis]